MRPVKQSRDFETVVGLESNPLGDDQVPAVYCGIEGVGQAPGWTTKGAGVKIIRDGAVAGVEGKRRVVGGQGEPPDDARRHPRNLYLPHRGRVIEPGSERRIFIDPDDEILAALRIAGAPNVPLRLEDGLLFSRCKVIAPERRELASLVGDVQQPRSVG